jgi:sulfur carrier protein
MPLKLTVNGQSREFRDIQSPATLASVIEQMELKSDRVAVELNGQIAARITWESAHVSNHDRLEIVHFVGGGSRGNRPSGHCSQLD